MGLDRRGFRIWVIFRVSLPRDLLAGLCAGNGRPLDCGSDPYGIKGPAKSQISEIDTFEVWAAIAKYYVGASHSKSEDLAALEPGTKNGNG